MASPPEAVMQGMHPEATMGTASDTSGCRAPTARLVIPPMETPIMAILPGSAPSCFAASTALRALV